MFCKLFDIGYVEGVYLEEKDLTSNRQDILETSKSTKVCLFSLSYGAVFSHTLHFTLESGDTT